MTFDYYDLLDRNTDICAYVWLIPKIVSGPRSPVTLNISKDNVQFGLRAIDQAGHRSPAAFPQVVS